MDSNYDFNGPDEASVVLPERIERSARKRLQAFIDEALQTEREQRRAFTRRFPEVPLLWPAWPYWDFGTIARL
jgi:hypothetical protein